MGLRVLAGLIAGATGIGDRGGLWAATVGDFEFPEEELGFSVLLRVCTVDPVPISFESVSEIGGAEGNFFFPDECRITSVTEKKY